MENNKKPNVLHYEWSVALPFYQPLGMKQFLGACDDRCSSILNFVKFSAHIRHVNSGSKRVLSVCEW